MPWSLGDWALVRRERLAHGAVVVGLVIALVVSGFGLGGPPLVVRFASPDARTIASGELQLAQARAEQADAARQAQVLAEVGRAAQVALEQARSARVEAAAVAVDPAQLAALDSATARLQTLLQQTDAAGASATGTSVRAAAADPGESAAGPSADSAAATGATVSSSEPAGSSPQPAATEPGTAPAATTGGPDPGSTQTPPGTTSTGTAAAASTGTSSGDPSDAGGAKATVTPAPELPVTTPQTLPDPVADQATILDVAPTAVDEVRGFLPAQSVVDDAATADLLDAVDQVAQTVAEVSAAVTATRVAAQTASETEQQAREAAEQAAAVARSRAARLRKDAHSLDAFPNGQVPLTALCSPAFDLTAHLRCDAAEMLDGLNRAYRAQFGTNLVVTDSYRSLDAQIVCSQEKGSLCADPGTSNHGLGIAVDLGGPVRWSDTPEHAWMLAHCAEYGWVKPDWSLDTGSKPEPWHFDFGGVPAG